MFCGGLGGKERWVDPDENGLERWSPLLPRPLCYPISGGFGRFPSQEPTSDQQLLPLKIIGDGSCLAS